MRKYILITLSILLMACSTLSIKDLQTVSNAPVIAVTPNETLVAEIVQATIEAAGQKISDSTGESTACTQAPCPTCAALDAPEIPSIIVTEPVNSEAEPKAIEITPTPTPNFTLDKIYQVQASSPVYLPNFGHQDLGCNWLGVAGQVFDLNGNPIPNVVVVVEGKLNGAKVDGVGVTGMTNIYGPGGYEIVLGNQALTSDGALNITLHGLNGVQQSEVVLFNTLANCQKNLTLINFTQIK